MSRRIDSDTSLGGILTAVVGLIMTASAIGNLYAPVHGWLVMGLGLIVIGLAVACLSYLGQQ